MGAHCASGLEILGLYIPAGTDGIPSRLAKEVFWRRLLEAQDSLRLEPARLAGDFNTGLWGVDMRGRGVPGSERFAELSRQGWIDAFRELHGDASDFSWWSRTGAFRIDHAFVSPVLRERLSRAEYLRRTASERLVRTPFDTNEDGAVSGLSDHAALVVELADPAEWSRRHDAPVSAGSGADLKSTARDASGKGDLSTAVANSMATFRTDSMALGTDGSRCSGAPCLSTLARERLPRGEQVQVQTSPNMSKPLLMALKSDPRTGESNVPPRD